MGRKESRKEGKGRKQGRKEARQEGRKEGRLVLWICLKEDIGLVRSTNLLPEHSGHCGKLRSG